MAQRNPVIPVTSDPSKLVSWPPEENVPATHETQRSQREHEEAATEKAKDAVHAGVDAAQQSFQNAQRKLAYSADLLQTKLRRFADESPLHFVAAIAGAAFIAGVALRIWRSSRYE